MFEALSDRFEGIFKKLRSRGTLREEDVDEVLREIRVALLEADVNITVVRRFQSRVRERCVGADLAKALDPASQVIDAVHQELIAVLGGEPLQVTFASRPPTVVLMAGLQGSGKTTTTAKLARWFKSQGRNPLLVGADLQRPAAVEQLRTLGRQVDVPVFSEPTDPVSVARRSLDEARRGGRDVVIVDTAGRLAIDSDMMEQVSSSTVSSSPSSTAMPAVARPCRSRRSSSGPSPSPRPARSWPISTSSIPTGWPRASSEWVTCSP
jgi:signal recognition particle subunit SRP54